MAIGTHLLVAIGKRRNGNRFIFSSYQRSSDQLSAKSLNTEQRNAERLKAKTRYDNEDI